MHMPNILKVKVCVRVNVSMHSQHLNAMSCSTAAKFDAKWSFRSKKKYGFWKMFPTEGKHEQLYVGMFSIENMVVFPPKNVSQKTIF